MYDEKGTQENEIYFYGNIFLHTRKNTHNMSMYRPPSHKIFYMSRGVLNIRVCVCITYQLFYVHKWIFVVVVVDIMGWHNMKMVKMQKLL